jgi:hypothetical protein
MDLSHRDFKSNLINLDKKDTTLYFTLALIP